MEEIHKYMDGSLLIVAPETSVREATRIMRDKKVGSLLIGED